MDEFWYDYVKPTHGKKNKFVRYGCRPSCIKADDIYEGTGEDVETRFDTSD